MTIPLEPSDESIHNWFELSYAQYLTIPRSVLQSMPEEWQARFVQCLKELDESIDWRPAKGYYRVELCELNEVWDEDQECYVQEWGQILKDPFMDYERGRRRVPLVNREEGERHA